ncbi:MAG: CDP-archaeol synthase [Armatimonadetes bacterium]|nr:CDP-archaeol synthase [Armatimonadota bacterium]
MLRRKVLTSFFVIPVLLAFLYLGGWPLFLFATVFMLGGMHEFYAALIGRGAAPVRWAGWLAGIGILAATQWATDEWRSGITTACIVGVVFASLLAQFRRPAGTSVLTNVGGTVFGVVYIPFLFSFFLRLRQLPLGGVEGIPLDGVRDRMGVVLLVLAAVWAMDTVANVVGGALGTARPWPNVSPSKTWEGCLSGLLAAMVVTLVAGAICHLPVLHLLALGALIGVIAQLGDFSESLIKRDLGLKDFGTVLPGHGGVLDRFDSLVFAMPVAYCYLYFLLRSLGAG